MLMVNGGTASPKAYKINKDLKEEEKMAKRFLVIAALLMLGFYVSGCSEGDDDVSVTNPNPAVFSPTGSISGVVVDQCTNTLVKGATVSVAYNGGVHKVVTDASGQFSFKDVPANFDGPYYVSCDLSKVTGNPYNGVAFVEQAFVGYDDLGDGDNSGLDEAVESGSGASTPVNKLDTSIIFEVSALTNSVTGAVFDKTYGTDPLAGATVALFNEDGGLLGSATTAANGTFTISSLPAGDDYYIKVIKAGYTYWSVVASSECVEGDCDMLELPCAVGCSSIPLNVGAFFVEQSQLRDNIIPFIENIDLQIGDYAVEGAYDWDVFSFDDNGEVLPAIVTSFGVTFSEPMLTGHAAIYDAIDLEADFLITVTTIGHTDYHTDWSSDFYTVEKSLAWDGTHTVLTIIPDITFDEDAIIADAAAYYGIPLGSPTITVQAGEYGITFMAGTLALADANGVPWSPVALPDYYMSGLSWIQDAILGMGSSNDFQILVGNEDYFD
jgi:hypothetical protein